MKSHIQIYEQQMAEALANRKFMAYLIKKHKIDVTKQREMEDGNQHILNCSMNYKAFFTYKRNDFFKKETYADRVPRQASDLIKHIVHKVTMKEQLLLLGRLINQFLPPKMQRVLIEKKCQNVLEINFEDENIYVMVDENHYTKKVISSPTSSSNLASPSSPGFVSQKSFSFDSPKK